MPDISLGYIGLNVSDPEAWRAFGRDVLGVMEAEASPAGIARLRVDEHAWRIALQPGDQDDLAYLGLEVAGPQELAEIEARLRSGGVEVMTGVPDLLAERGVMALIRCADPQGLPVELFYGPTHAGHIPFVSPQGASFVTGQQGLGHVVLTTTDLAAFRRFYLDLLGFQQSDSIRMKLGPAFSIDLEFYYGNPRHHTLAVAPLPMATPKRTHHIMLEVASLDQVGFALDRLAATGGRLVQTLGRHSNDKMVSFYCATPSGFELEYGWGGVEIDDLTWRMARHDRISDWGHKRL